MGAGLLEFYRKKVKIEWKVAFVATVIFGFLVHSFRFTNTLLNHDALYNYYASQNMVGSGRWFLAIACGFSSFFDLPWFNGVLSILFIALTAVVIVDIFKMTNPVLITIVSGLLVTFPAITETFSFEFTADGYMLAMLFAALAVRLAAIGEKKILPHAAAAILICLTCAVYQAYVSFALVLAIAYFITELLEDKFSVKDYLTWVGLEIAVYGVGMAAYMVVWKICMAVQDFEATAYLGMDNLGQVGLENIIAAFGSTVKSTIFFFIEGNIFKHGLTMWSGLNILFLIAAAAAAVTAVIKSKIYKRGILFGLCLLAAAAIPFAVYIWYFVTSASYAYSVRMEQSMCVVYILTAVLFERWMSTKWSTMAGVLLAVIIFNNSVTANVYYNFMAKSNQQSYAAAIEISSRIHDLDDGTIQKIAIGGALPFWTEEDYQNPEQLGTLGLLKNVDKNVLRNQTCTALYLANELGFTLSYYQENALDIPPAEKNPYEPVPDNWEFRFPMASASELTEIKSSEEYQAMPCWPARDSVRVFGDTIVVKLSKY